MLYETLSQPYIFLCLSLGGFFCGFIFDLKDIILSFFKKQTIIKQILLFFAVFSTFFIYFYLNLKVNFGQIRFFPMIIFSLAFYIQRFIIKNFLANPVIRCYNKTKEKFHGKRKKMVEKV